MAPRTTGKRSLHNKPWEKSNPGLAQGRGGPRSLAEQNIIYNVPTTVDTSNGDTTAQLKQQNIAMATKVMIDRERNMFFGDLIEIRRGTREVERFIKNQEYLQKTN